MMKRTFEEAFGHDSTTGDVLGEVSFKYRGHLDVMKGGFAPTLCNQSCGMGAYSEIDYQAYLNMEECALMAEAHAIETRKEEQLPQELIELREIKKVKRKVPSTIQQNILVDQPETITTDPELQGVELEDQALEKVEIEYLEKLSADCKIPVNREKAFVMKKLTDILLNAVTREKTTELRRTRAENIVLKRAFKLQTEVVQKTRDSCEDLKQENQNLKQGLELAAHENRLLLAKIRELQMQEFSYCHDSNPSKGWGGDIAGF
jgi:hypothetical protein